MVLKMQLVDQQHQQHLARIGKHLSFSSYSPSAHVQVTCPAPGEAGTDQHLLSIDQCQARWETPRDDTCLSQMRKLRLSVVSGLAQDALLGGGGAGI